MSTQDFSTFPITNSQDGLYEGYGLSKRELIAAMAMQGLLSNLSAIRKEGFKNSDIEEFAVIRVDALLKALGAI